MIILKKSQLAFSFEKKSVRWLAKSRAIGKMSSKTLTVFFIKNLKFSAQDEIVKKQKTAGQSKALKKQRSRGISGCSSRKYSGYDDEMDEDFGDDEDYDHYGGQEVFDEDEEDTFVAKK